MQILVRYEILAGECRAYMRWRCKYSRYICKVGRIMGSLREFYAYTKKKKKKIFNIAIHFPFPTLMPINKDYRAPVVFTYLHEAKKACHFEHEIMHD